jgi:hypothetical protein
LTYTKKVSKLLLRHVHPVLEKFASNAALQIMNLTLAAASRAALTAIQAM